MKKRIEEYTRNNKFRWESGVKGRHFIHNVLCVIFNHVKVLSIMFQKLTIFLESTLTFLPHHASPAPSHFSDLLYRQI